jgi:hypothetical protein
MARANHDGIMMCKGYMMTRLLMGIAAISLGLIPVAAHASGSGGGGGGYSGGYSQPVNPAQQAYSRGLSLFKKRITCKKCEYSKGVPDSVTAREVMKRVNAGEFNLKPQERSLIAYYVSDRYSVK